MFAIGDVSAADRNMAGIAGRQAATAAGNILALIHGESDLTGIGSRARRSSSCQSGLTAVPDNCPARTGGPPPLRSPSSRVATY